MKLYQYITSSAICLGLFFSSCNDWLDVTPVDTRTSENFYQTPSQLEQAIIGIYNGLMPLSEYSWMMSEIRSDNVWVPYKLGKQRDYVDIACFNSNITTISTISNAWNDLYEIIARANLFLSKVDQVEFSADLDNVKKQFIGEAKFLRGLAYFELVRYFGRIPVVLEPISIEKAMTIKQSETVEVYENAIIPDLQDAISSLMNEPLNYAGKSASAGRATLSAAQSLLGRVYLTMAGFPIQDESKKDLAKELFKEVIDYSDANNHKFWAKDMDEWNKMWISENDNKYHIFEIQYMAANGYGNPMVPASVPSVSPVYTAVKLLGNTVYCEKSLDKILTQKDENDEFIDQRCHGTIETGNMVDEDGRPYTGEDFYVKLFEHNVKRKELGYSDISSQIVDRNYFPTNYPLIRLEDVMLMYAEITGPTEGKEYVDRIRTRAGLPALDENITPANFADSVDIERRRELASEGIRWHDIVRQGRFKPLLQEMFKRYASEGDETYNLYLRVKDGTYLYPIPDAQMKVKEGLYEQNAAYK